MTKAEYDSKLLSLKFTHDYNMLCFIRGQYIESLEAEIAELKAKAIVWHKYPDEKPVNGRFYATKMKDSKDVEAHFWRGGAEYWADMLYDDRIEDIIIKKIEDSDIAYWAKLPEFSE